MASFVRVTVCPECGAALRKALPDAIPVHPRKEKNGSKSNWCKGRTYRPFRRPRDRLTHDLTDA